MPQWEMGLQMEQMVFRISIPLSFLGTFPLGIRSGFISWTMDRLLSNFPHPSS
jgi:hypothetical protein